MIVGRYAEREAIASFLRDSSRSSAALVLEGEPGIGKTTLWVEALAEAKNGGYTLLASEPAEPDTGVPLSTLGDLLDRVDIDALTTLPEPQSAAIRVSLLRAEGEPVEWRALAVAVVSVLRILAAENPVLVAIDDVQWVDPSSERVLAFAFRRLNREPVRALLARRSEPLAGAGEIDLALARFGRWTIDLRPLAADEVAEIVGGTVTRPIPDIDLREIQRLSEGNPFYAVELALAAERGEKPPPGLAVPIPAKLRADIARRRFADLSPDAMDQLLVASAAARPTVAMMAAVVGAGRVDPLLDEAERSGIVRVERGDIRFAHHLFRSAVYSDASRLDRMRAHARLAAVLEGEDRARHLALSTDVADEGVAAEIERAADAARARGASDAAADLREHAARLTRPDDAGAVARRMVDLADDLFMAGDGQQALEHARRALELTPRGPARAHALLRLAEIEAWAFVDQPAAWKHREEALQEAEGNQELLCLIESALGWSAIGQTDFSAAQAHADEAVRRAGAIADDATAAQAYALAIRICSFYGCHDPLAAVRDRPSVWELSRDVPLPDSPKTAAVLAFLWLGDVDRAQALNDELFQAAAQRGDEVARSSAISNSVEMAIDEGRWREALPLAHEAVELAEQFGDSTAETRTLAWLEAMLGYETEAEAHAMVGGEATTLTICDRILRPKVLGAIELANGRVETAWTYLRAAAAAANEVLRPGVGTPMWPFIPDAIEAALGVGALDEAERLVSWLEERGETLDLAYARALGARGRGLLHAAAGDLAEAERCLEAALEHHARQPRPFDIARTSLVLGRIQRRASSKQAARRTLEDALLRFQKLGATVWMERTREELRKIGGRRPSGDQLTTAEQKVARLAATGRSNKEISKMLFMSTRTVEGHLSRVYAKLQIRSRTDLAALLNGANPVGAAKAE